MRARFCLITSKKTKFKSQKHKVHYSIFGHFKLRHTPIYSRRDSHHGQDLHVVSYLSHIARRLLWKTINELRDLYSLPNIVWVVKSRRMRWAGHVVRMGEGRGVHMVLLGKPEGRRPLWRPRRRWEDNIKTDLQEVGGVCRD